MKNTSWKTTLWGAIAGVILLGLTIALVVGKIDVTAYAAATGGALSFILPIWGMLQKDGDKTGLPTLKD